MAYDRSVDRLVIHGGGTVERDLGDTWAWTPDGWTGLGTAGPGPRSHHVMAYHPPSETLVLYGGGRDADGFGSDTWILNGATWRRSPGHLRPGRVLPGMVAAEDRILLFGGLVRGGHRPPELWGWRDHAWTLLDSDGPAGRIYPGLAWHAAAGHVILFGGEGDNGYLGVTWVWNGSNWSRRSTERDPPPRTEHTLTYDRRRDIVVLFGGRSADGLSDALWEWDGRLWSKIR